MSRKFAWSILFMSLIVSLMLSACAPAAATPAAVVKQPGAVTEKMVVVTAAAQPTLVPVSVSGRDSGSAGVSPYNRMIIKNGEMTLLVADTDVAVGRATDIAVETGGYVVSSRVWVQDGFKFATLTMGVPVDQFETAQSRLRTLAVQVLNETASGQDVSDEYVDLQSRLVNLQATEARIREFLQQAKDVDEALQVNAKLTEVEAEIEQVKGRMTYLKDRAAFSTIAVTFEPQRPTPTPTPIPTPAVWRPDKTVQAATGSLVVILQGLTDLLIWVVVLLGPFAIPAAIIGWLVWLRLRKKETKPQSDKTS